MVFARKKEYREHKIYPAEGFVCFSLIPCTGCDGNVPVARRFTAATNQCFHDSISGASAELDAGVRASVSRARIFRSFCASFWVFFLSGGHDFGNNAGVRDEAVERLSLNDSISLLLAVRAKQVFRISDPRELCKIQVRPVRASKFSYL